LETGRHFQFDTCSEIPGLQLLDFTEEKDALGTLLYIGIGWMLCPVLFLYLMCRPQTRAIGTVLFLAWLFLFMIPRVVEFIALFVVLPGMLAVGVIRGIIKRLK